MQCFFKAKAPRRKDRKFIDVITKHDGTELYTPEDIRNEFVRYYTKLFSTTHSTNNLMQPRITNELNEKLLEPYIIDEIKLALFQMHPDKAPGVDGYSAAFYQKFWDHIKEDICEELLNFLNNDLLDTQLNITQIVLLPKKEECLRVEDFRPISLCNVAMKLIIKVLANRLCVCLPLLIDQNQSAFLKNRCITYNILLAQEACHSVKKRKTGSAGFLSIKVDMSKAYDRAEWKFFRKVMKIMGFHPTWINKIIRCVESVSYKIKINDQL